jgi:signal transduction histidine kinase
MSLYVFLTLLGTALLIGVGYSGLVKVSQEALAFASVLIALAATFAGILTFPSFQSFIERRLLGIKLPAQSLVADYSARIVTSTTLSGLLRLLEEEVFPSLLVRQYAFVQVANASAKNLLSKNVTQDQVREDAMRDLAASVPTDRLIRFPEEEQPLGWVRLILLLRIGSDPIGAWLLGRRDPDDLYPQVEFPILQSLANQTAVALSNILQTERLQRMYEDDIERNEKSRQLLALDLHDSVLNQLAVLHVSVDPAHASEKFENAYKEVTSRLREIVSNLRPPMLTYGLKPVIEELADNLMDRRDNTIHVVTRIEAVDGARYAENVELHLFRIIQEACENALRHGHATEIKLSAELAPEHIRLCIEDNGIGFETGGQIELDLLQANKHFGLSGMLERAMLIGATVEIRSSPGHGTEVRVVWNKANSTR